MDTAMIEECKPRLQTQRLRLAFEDVLASLPHFEEARSDLGEDCSEDEAAVHRIGQIVRRLALGHGATACSSHRQAGHSDEGSRSTPGAGRGRPRFARHSTTWTLPDLLAEARTPECT